MSKRSKQTGNFYKKRARLMDEVERNVDALNITLETASTSVWPDLGVEVTPEDLELLFAGCSSAEPTTSTTTTTSNATTTSNDFHEFEDIYDSADVVTDANDRFEFMKNLNLKDALVHLIILGRASRFLTEGFLAILRKFFKAKVPKTKRTFLKTKADIKSEITPINGGKLWYRGIEKVLLKYFE
uniref:uncharacterized protein LOC125906602 isoform X1 n=1 Tax=Anopheles coluzzii TaxID=1518534 RepID=UPI0020FFBE3C|nr:uncharacterized protein LOC125906602 isoform X1 [Anopheles coluzzii]